jgi:hypothetical protein
MEGKVSKVGTPASPKEAEAVMKSVEIPAKIKGAVMDKRAPACC